MVTLTLFPVENSILEEEEVDWVIIFLQQNRAGVLYGMRVEHLQSFLHSETREEFSGPAQLGGVVGMIQATLCEVKLEEECTWQTIVLIPKGNGKF